LVNAADNKQSDAKMSNIDVTVKRSASNGIRVTITNNGRGIPATLHRTEKMYTPQLIFGNLLTGSNFDDTKVL
jgi:DNA topoisomerase II